MIESSGFQWNEASVLKMNIKQIVYLIEAGGVYAKAERSQGLFSLASNHSHRRTSLQSYRKPRRRRALRPIRPAIVAPGRIDVRVADRVGDRHGVGYIEHFGDKCSAEVMRGEALDISDEASLLADQINRLSRQPGLNHKRPAFRDSLEDRARMFAAAVEPGVRVS